MKMLFLVFLFWATSVSAQNSISRNANVSLFGGYLARQQNINEYAYYYGAYADCPIVKWTNFNETEFNIGFYGVYSQSTFNQNLTLNISTTQEIAGGLNSGVYSEGNGSSSFYGGLALGYKYAKEIGRVNKTNYYSKNTQSDKMIVGNLNMNRFRNNSSWFTRTQAIVSGQMSLNSDKILSENGSPDSLVRIWNKDFQEVYLKQSIVDIPLNLSGELLLEPKIGAAYHHYDSGFSSAISLIGEISLKKLFSDDLLSVTFQYKMYPVKKTDYVIISASVNILRLIEKK